MAKIQRLWFILLGFIWKIDPNVPSGVTRYAHKNFSSKFWEYLPENFRADK